MRPAIYRPSIGQALTSLDADVRHLEWQPELDHSLGDPLIVIGALRHGRMRVASDALADAARDGFAEVKPDFLHTSSLRLWAKVAIIVDDADAAAVLSDRMTPLAPLFTAARTASFGIPVQSVLGRLATVSGRMRDALPHHRSAVAQARKARADHLVAEAPACLASGVAATADAERADVELAIDAAVEAAEICAHTGAQPTLDVGRRARWSYCEAAEDRGSRTVNGSLDPVVAKGVDVP